MEGEEEEPGKKEGQEREDEVQEEPEGERTRNGGGVEEEAGRT